jgi:hypothetical protein
MTEEKRAYILHRLATDAAFVYELGIKNGMRENEILEKAAAALPPEEFELTPPPPPTDE